jgi:hypothetical protein
MFLTDSAHFFRPAFTASSMLVLEAALSSMILATDMVVSLECRRHECGHGDPNLRRDLLSRRLQSKP